MKRSRARPGLIVASVLALVATALPKDAEYLDPGTGSYVFQIVVGTVLGAAVAVKMTWRRLWGVLTRRSSGARQREDTRSPK